MSRLIVISERTDHEDGSREIIAEVNEDDGSAQYSRTPFFFAPDVTEADAEAAIVAELGPYLNPEDAQVVSRGI